ncbi:hypothetical protein HK405_009013 [Cladochytrium tenue]|nr:hypothetical protein HK405_009013 [Cladochytrium tenue]
MADSMLGGAKAGASVNVPALYPTHGGTPRRLGAVERFTLSAMAPAVAVIFTNPFDTAKTRLQLQKKSAPNVGLYDPLMSSVHDPSKGSPPPWKRMVVGAVCGGFGAISSNPFELVKTRLQSQAASTSLAVGHQHQYRGVIDGLRSIVRTDGIFGLYRGSVLSIGRSVLGSGANLSAYSLIREHLIIQKGWNDSWLIDVVAGLGSASDRDGKLDSDELSAVLREVFPSGVMRKDAEYEAMISTFVERVLDTADKDHDRAISFNEYSGMANEIRAIYLEQSASRVLGGK